MIKTIRKTKLSAAPVFFSDKNHTIVVKGGKGTTRTKESKSAEFLAPSNDDGGVDGTLLGDDQRDMKGAAIVILECGFHESVHPAIRASVFNEKPFGNETHVMAFRKRTSTSLIDAALVYRHVQTANLDVYEVLFLAVHPGLKRTGLGRVAVDHLKKILEASESNKTQTICVSLKSESSEAAKFWKSAGLNQLKKDMDDWHYAELTGKMVEFDDFLPYAAFF